MEDLLQAATYLQSPSILAECCKARLCPGLCASSTPARHDLCEVFACTLLLTLLAPQTVHDWL